ncbi:MAG: PhnD/SsuA/transferrin family substrate-binding protein [Duodenibacillus sp.]|nr:PhnD/SsuA/transferrin family substrate-binding protein [Duodenibacillus sp.]
MKSLQRLLLGLCAYLTFTVTAPLHAADTVVPEEATSSAIGAARFEAVNRHPPTDRPVFTFAVTHFSHPYFRPHIVDSALSILSTTLLETGYHFRPILLNPTQVEEAVRLGTIDGFLGPAGLYRRMSESNVRDLATVVTRESPDPNRGAASTFIVRNDSPIKTIRQTKGRTVSAKDESSYNGWRIAMSKLFDMGEQPDTFFKQVNFIGILTDHIFEDVYTGRSEVGIVPECFLEEYLTRRPSRAAAFRVLDPIPADDTLRCVRSTELYPNWTVAVTGNVSPELSKLLTKALLTAPTNDSGVSWSLTTDYSRLDALQRNLKIGRYAYLRSWSLKRLIQTYWPFLALGLMALVTLCIHTVRVNRLVKCRTKQLEDAIVEHANFKQEALASQSRLDAFERMGKASYLSSIVAHELRQPLAAISFYTNGIDRLMKKPVENAEKISQAVAEIRHLAHFSDQIVEKARSYAKNRHHTRAHVDVVKLAQRAVANYVSTGTCYAVIRCLSSRPVMATIDPLEMELVFINLMRNADEALQSVANGQITLTVEQEDDEAVIVCKDNGRMLSDDVLSRIRGEAHSTKLTGMGVGLGIVKTIIENHMGDIRFDKGELGGLLITIRFPLSRNTPEDINELRGQAHAE